MEGKDWGLAIKDMVFGLGGAVAGVMGGPAAAEGVAKAGGGLDRMIGTPPEATPARADRFDRADFSARPKKKSPSPPAASTKEEAEPPGGDEALAAEFLRAAGWPAGQADEILRGPQSPKEKDDVAEGPEPAPLSPSLRTFEVYGVQNGTAVPLMSVLERKEGRWQIKPGAQIRATDRSSVGMGLAGVPGRWPEAYPKHRPEDYGLHAGKAVLYWEPRRGRALAASAGLLTQLLGRNWRSTVYRTEEEHG